MQHNFSGHLAWIMNFSKQKNKNLKLEVSESLRKIQDVQEISLHSRTHLKTRILPDAHRKMWMTVTLPNRILAFGKI